ncbi:hypothetical protein SDC9_108173 [bioreactor metagenome]|uniref:Uncharacterized protein n=1 Tax=bioreactor metagenome TaxID=1076179 RepID=A0A645B7B6_9ZZZZ
MKIALFRHGAPGTLAKLPGAFPEVEHVDCLGGFTRLTPITKRLTLVTLEDGEALELPVQYTLRRLDRAPQRIYGDCLVAALREDGTYTDVTPQDLRKAEQYILPVRQAVV